MGLGWCYPSMERRAWLISHDQTKHGVAQERAVANPLTCRELFPGKLSISSVYTARRPHRLGRRDFMGLRSSTETGPGASQLADLTEGSLRDVVFLGEGWEEPANIGQANARSFLDVCVSRCTMCFIVRPVSFTPTVVYHESPQPSKVVAPSTTASSRNKSASLLLLSSIVNRWYIVVVLADRVSVWPKLA